MLELNFDDVRIQHNPSEIVVHPKGHAGLWADCRAGVCLIWEEGKVVLMSTRFFPDAGCYVSAQLMTFPDRPFPKDAAQAIGIIRNALSQFAAALVAAYPSPVPCQVCNGSGSDLFQGVGSCEACQGFGVIQP